MPSKTVRIVNKTKNTILAEKAEIADTPLTRIKGLLGRETLTEGEGLVISPCNSIHTFFMRFKIDAVFLNKEGMVVGVAESLPPSKLFAALSEGKLVIELPSGTIDKTKTTLKDQVFLQGLT